MARLLIPILISLLSSGDALYAAIPANTIWEVRSTASDLNGDTASRSVGDSVVHAAVLQDIADSNQPNYPKKALSDKVEGVVRLDVEIDPDGKVRSVYSSEGNLILAEAASQAIHKWRFHPAQINGKPVEDKVRIKVEFRLDGERIRTEVVWPETPPSVTPAP